MATDRLTKHFDPAGWQWQDEHGQVFQLEDLSRADLLQVACACMEALEQAETNSAAQAELFKRWRVGGMRPAEESTKG